MDIPSQPQAPDLQRIKARQQETWASGNYAAVGSLLQIVGEMLCEAVPVMAGDKVLDVAAGNGNASLAAARRFANVTSTDYVAALIERGRTRARADGLEIAFREADAEALPFAENTFDVVLSTFGVMFTPNQQKAADELWRVTRPGGRIGLANWTPDGFIGQLFKTIGRHVPPAAGLQSPALWGTEGRLSELFGGRATLRVTAKNYVFRYRSADHFVDYFRTNYGPTLKAFETLDAAGKTALADDIKALITTFNASGNATMAVPSAYLEVVATKR